MAESTRRGSGYSRSMSTDELVGWLEERGVAEKDRGALSDESFTGQSFLLLDSASIKELGIKMSGRLQLNKLIKEASISIEPEDNGVLDEGRVVVPPASTLIVNNFSESSPTGGTNIRVQEMRDPQESPTRQQGEEDVTREPVSPVSQAQASGDATTRALPSNRDNEDVAREEEAPVYCTQGLESGTSVFSFDHTVHMYRNKIWAGRELLKVTFLNPDVLNSWGLTRDNILDWAKVWDVGNEKVPTFKQVPKASRADIRVLLSETQACSSKIGMDAEKVQPVTNPTMVLNLRGLPAHLQRSLVIHEFGHALGLDHEHQRSDFWDAMSGYFERGNIPPTQASRVLKKMDSIDFDQVLEYDPDSIMHYWFDPDWLKMPRHRVRQNINTDNTLSAKEKRYLLGVHMRQGQDLLPRQPSETDLRFLESAYGADQCSVFPGRRELNRVSSRDWEPKLPRDTVLQVNIHKQEILNTIWDVRAQWRVIGDSLGLSVGELDAIHANSSDYLNDVLVSWITQGNKYIGELLVVLRSPAVGRADLAEKIIKTN
ncbi:uncharacterized protein LOC135332882 isoform X2 [Halichondria panicea]|uniref:uncharacterized protein LOC135332882 isoform X2 n=1 Tax=Halichondria panicea TaxID=6063 RepID=UPI00312B66AC